MIKPGEKIPESIKIVKTDKKFPGDCRVETECRHCGFRTALTAFETLCQAMLFGRNDSTSFCTEAVLLRYHWCKA